MMPPQSFFPRIATAVSGLDPLQNGTSDPAGRAQPVARSSQLVGSVRRATQLALALAIMTFPSCLITTDPDVSPPKKRPPRFIPDTATPSTDTVVPIKPGESKTFSAFFQSEDASVDLDARLYLDYGSSTQPSKVYLATPIPVDSDIPLGSWDEPRSVSADYNGEWVLSEGCHRFTLMLVHQDFVGKGCAAEDGDYDTVTWFVQFCPTEPCLPFDADTCPPLATDGKCPSAVIDETGGGPQ